MLLRLSFVFFAALSTLAMSLLIGGCATGTGANPPPPEVIEVKPLFSSAQLEEVRRLVQETASTYPGGIAVGIRAQDSLILLEAFGDRVDGSALNENTVFEIGSVTKQFTAALVLRAEERGLLSLDDTIQKHLPNYPEATFAITIGHLLGHTSGIPNYTNSPTFMDDRARVWRPEEIVGLFSNASLNFEPGTAFAYSNSNYFLLGLILEGIHVASYAEIVETELFAALELDATGYCDVDPSTQNRAQGFTNGGASQSVHMSQPGAAGALCSTAADLLTWSSALHRGDVVTHALDIAGVLNTSQPSPYGFGLFVGRTNWRPTVSHGGNIPGFTARTAHYSIAPSDLAPSDLAPSTPSTGEGEGEGPNEIAEHEVVLLDLVLLANQDGADLTALEIKLVEALVGAWPRSPPEGPLTSEIAASMVGDYNAPGLPPIAISFDAENATLNASFNRAAPVVLSHLSARDFSYAPATLFLRFPSDSPGVVEIEQHGALLTLTSN